MNTVPNDLSTDAGPPIVVPLRHFLVGFGFLIAGGVGAIVGGSVPSVGVVHLLLVGWVCVTILGAMTQFVPVWSGVELHSLRLARLQLPLVGVGVTGLAAAFHTGRIDALIPFATVLVSGFAVFVYNIARTLWPARPWDVTERHFALALAFFTGAVAIGWTLALDFVAGLFPVVGPGATVITRTSAVSAHVTLAVFGGVFVTVAGALYQLGPMFTQSEPTRIDHHLRGVETVALPAGVVLLALGRLLGHAPIARIGAVGVVVGVLIVGIVLSRRLVRATASYSPMLPRYAVFAVACVGWASSAGWVWALDPLSVGNRFGAGTPGAVLAFGAVAFVVAGTLYHVVPFVVWVRRYSDRVGLEPVPMIDDLYHGRLARAELGVTVVGFLLVVVSSSLWFAPVATGRFGAVALLAGGVLFASTLAHTVFAHAPRATGLPMWR